MDTIYDSYGNRVTLDRKQQACVDYKGKKNIDLVVQGIAGAGKSLVLMARAVACIKENPDDKIAIFTYNRTLTSYISDTLKRNNILVDKIKIATLDSYLNEVFSFMPGHFSGYKVYDRLRYKLMEQAISDHAEANGSSTRLHNVPVKYWLEEVTWIKEHDIGVDEFYKYLMIKRAGRGTNVHITDKDKVVVFEFYQLYCDLLIDKHLFEWEDRYLFISHNVEKIPDRMKFDHIFIDEGQDQTKAKILGLYGLKRRPTSDLTVAMDMNQRIYARDNPFSGQNREVKKLDKTYRCSVEIDALAESLRKHNDEFLDEEDKNPHIVPSVSTGILPKIHGCADSAEEKEYVIRLIQEWQVWREKITIAILSTTNDQIDTYSSWLAEAGIRHEKITKEDEFSVWSPGVKVATIYSAKGMEFTHVIIPQFSEGIFPHIHERTDEQLIKEEVNRSRSLAYVGMTRAMKALTITYSGVPSRFIGEMDTTLCKFEPAVVNNVTSTPRRVAPTSTSKYERILSPPPARKSTRTSTRSSSSNSSSSSICGTLKSFFESKGLEVIDKRPNGGCLWVVGSESEIGSIVNEAKSKFHAGGNYGAGRATGQRRGWFTRANR